MPDNHAHRREAWREHYTTALVHLDALWDKP